MSAEPVNSTNSASVASTRPHGAGSFLDSARRKAPTKPVCFSVRPSARRWPMSTVGEYSPNRYRSLARGGGRTVVSPELFVVAAGLGDGVDVDDRVDTAVAQGLHDLLDRVGQLYPDLVLAFVLDPRLDHRALRG